MGNAPHENTETFRTVAGRNHWQQARFLFWLESGENGAEFFCVPVRPNGFHKSLASRLLSRQNVMDIRWMHRINALGHEEMGRTVM